jgi:hypothetical protein
MSMAAIRERYERFVQTAEDQCRKGGDPAVAAVYATLALAEATRLNEPSERLEISGALTVDS